jgi:ribonucleoside-diphosphate reductase alpha chain
VPVESLVRKFEHVRFEPSGMTRNPEIPIAKSLVDYIFRWLAMEFVPGYRAANAPKREKKNPAPAKAETPAGPELRKGNGHHSRLEGDSPKPFDYGSGLEGQVESAASSAPPAGQGTLSTEGSVNLRAMIVADPLSQQGSNMQADAPACDVCGSITVRSGTCYKCLNCGNSMGCS